MSKTSSSSFEDFYKKVHAIINDARNTIYHKVNLTMVRTYWQIGRAIVEEEQNGESRADYGFYLIEKLADKLTMTYGKGFDKRNLAYMRKFYLTFPIMNALRSQLTWTHYRILTRIDNPDAIKFYMDETIQGNWSTRQLERQVNSLYYERILMTNKENRSLVKKEADQDIEQLLPSHIIKDPYVLEFLNVKTETIFYEKSLEQALIDRLQEFLLELGKGFSFVKRQYRISTDGNHFYVDLVFYNYILKCFLLIDLKTGELCHQDIGQMDFYVRFFEDQIRQKGDNPTIGLILCNEKDNTIVKYSVLSENKQIFASKYTLYLPDDKTLKDEINKERDVLESEKKLN